MIQFITFIPTQNEQITDTQYCSAINVTMVAINKIDVTNTNKAIVFIFIILIFLSST